MAGEQIKEISNWDAGRIFDTLLSYAEGESMDMSMFYSATDKLNISNRKKSMIGILFQESSVVHALKELRTVPELWSLFDWNKIHQLKLLLQHRPEALIAYLSQIYRIWHTLYHPCKGWEKCKKTVEVDNETVAEFSGLYPKRSHLDRSIILRSIARHRLTSRVGDEELNRLQSTLLELDSRILTFTQFFDEAEFLGGLMSVVPAKVKEASGEELLPALMYASQALVGRRFTNARLREELIKDIECRLHFKLADDSAPLAIFRLVRELSLQQGEADYLINQNLAFLKSVRRVRKPININTQTTRIRHLGRRKWWLDDEHLSEYFSYLLSTVNGEKPSDTPESSTTELSRIDLLRDVLSAFGLISKCQHLLSEDITEHSHASQSSLEITFTNTGITKPNEFLSSCADLVTSGAPTLSEGESLRSNEPSMQQQHFQAIGSAAVPVLTNENCPPNKMHETARLPIPPAMPSVALTGNGRLFRYGG